MTINDLAFELTKDKSDTKTINAWEKKIKSWEDEKDYPTLDEIYQMAYIININPGELLAIRNRGRKQFYKEDNKLPSEKKHWYGLNEDAVWVFQGLARAFIIFVVFIFCFKFYQFIDTYYGETGGIVVDQVITQDIQKHTGQENEIINDGSVQNMVDRVKRESRGIHDNTVENEIDIQKEFKDVLNEAENIIEN